nr:hypothetical protein [Microvirga aerophila]
MHAQDPPATAGFDAVNGIACDSLKCLRQQRFRETEKQQPHAWAGSDYFVKAINRDSGCGSVYLYDISSERLAADHGADEAEQCFPAEHCHLNGVAILHDGYKGNNRVVREIRVMDRFAGVKEDLAPRQLHELEMWFNERVIIRVKGRQNSINTVTCRFRSLI